MWNIGYGAIILFIILLSMDTGLAVAVMTTSYISIDFWDRLVINLVFVAVALHNSSN
jgi:hypothetical protein